MNDAKLFEAVRMLQDATKLLDAILVEQIGTHTVVSNEPQLPKLWKVSADFEAAKQWATRTGKFKLDTEENSFVGNCGGRQLWWEKHSSFEDNEGINHTEITREQFVEWVYNPWKASLNQPDYDVSNVAPKFEIGDKVEVNGIKGIITGLHGINKYFVQTPKGFDVFHYIQLTKIDPPKFDPNTSDWDRMYFAESEDATGIVVYATNTSEWLFITNNGEWPLSICTHIDHEPIERRN
jgi:hypothetical protein